MKVKINPKIKVKPKGKAKAMVKVKIHVTIYVKKRINIFFLGKVGYMTFTITFP